MVAEEKPEVVCFGSGMNGIILFIAKLSTISGTGTGTMMVIKTMLLTYLERMFLRRQQSLVVPPSLNQRESPRLPSGVGQSVDDILKIIMHQI